MVFVVALLFTRIRNAIDSLVSPKPHIAVTKRKERAQHTVLSVVTFITTTVHALVVKVHAMGQGSLDDKCDSE